MKTVVAREYDPVAAAGRAMRIAVDLTPVKSVGTRVYLEGFVPALAQAADGETIRIFVSPQISEVSLPPGVERVAVRAASTVAGRLVWQQFGLPRALRRFAADVLFAPFEFAPLMARGPVVLGSRNPSPHLDNRPASVLRRILTAASCRRAERVVFVSRASAADLSARLDIPEAKRVVIPHGSRGTQWERCPDPEPVLRRYDVAGVPYLLFVSQLYRYKHPHTLIEAFARWRQSSGRGEYRLLMTGEAVEAGFEAELKSLVERRALRSYVRLLGHIPAADLPILYQNAAAFVMPTAIETFGHPFVEAMASGTPVVCADIEVAREVCGDAAAYSPVGDAGALAAVIESVVGDETRRREMIRRGLERAPQFTWAQEATATLALLREVASRPRPRVGSGRGALLERLSASTIPPPERRRSSGL